jgi:predicted dehydrogenase
VLGPDESGGVSLRVTIIGCGSAGTRRARALRALGIGHISVTDQEPGRARSLAEMVGGEVAESPSAAVANADAVLVCTPPASRAAIALAAARDGAHVFVESPLGDDLRGLGRLGDAAATGRRVLMIGSWARFHPALERIRALLEARTVGRVYAVSMWLGVARTERPQPAASADGRRGSVLGAAAWLDALCWLFGKPVEVAALHASPSTRGLTLDGSSVAIVRLDRGGLVQVYADDLHGSESTRIEVVGTEGTIIWAAGGDRIAVSRLGGRERRDEQIPVDEDEITGAELRHFFACVLTGRRPVMDVTEGRAVLELALAIRRAARTRRTTVLGEQTRGAGRRGLPPLLRLVHAG